MNEMELLQRMRAGIPAPTDDEVGAGEDRLRLALRARGRPSRPLASNAARRRLRRAVLWPSVTAALASTAAAVVVAVSSGDIARAPDTAEGQAIVPVAVAQILDRAALSAQNIPELSPRPDQFIVYKSVEMNSMTINGTPEQRYLYRTERELWASVDGKHDGALLRTFLQPRPYPGWPLPSRALREAGTEKLLPVPACDSAGTPNEFRRDYPYLKTLPTDADGMLAVIKRRTGEKDPSELQVWRALSGLLAESYLPSQQRAAVFRAAKQISGVTLVDTAKDAVGRVGVAVSRIDEDAGARTELIFDPATFAYRGQGSYVVDATTAKAPIGSQISATAELSVSVVDSVPEVPGGEIDANGRFILNSDHCK
jgi:hypothetical protein